MYLLAEKRKVLKEIDISSNILNMLINETDKPASEFDPGLDPRLFVHNRYFEFTPLSMVDKTFLG